MSAGGTRPRVEQICDAALQVDVLERDAFVSAACAGDEAMHRAVGALLAHVQTAARFLETPAGAGELVADRYRIVAFLGHGGMGRVYRADDLRVGQAAAALKFLPSAIERDPRRLESLKCVSPVRCRIPTSAGCTTSDPPGAAIS
jgi:hypothetical protein